MTLVGFGVGQAFPRSRARTRAPFVSFNTESGKLGNLLRGFAHGAIRRLRVSCALLPPTSLDREPAR